MARRDPEPGEPARDRRDLGVRLGVVALARLDAWDEQAVLLELAREPRVDPGAFAQRRLVELGAGLAKADGSLSPAVGRGRRVERLADPVQRQELVPLQAQDPLEPIDVVLREEAIAAARALRVHESLALEVTDLRDRDVRELALQPLADRPDRQEPLARGGPGRP